MITPATDKAADDTRLSGSQRMDDAVSLEPADMRSAFKALLWFSLLYFAVRLPWLLCVPITEAPDEANHLWVAQFLRDHLRLPDAHEVASAGTPAVYGSLPQLGYLPHLLVGQLFPAEKFTEVARYGSLLAGLPTVWFAWLLGREVFADSRMRRVALPLLVVCHPQLAFTQSYTNNDTLVITLGSAAIYLAVRALKHGLTKLNATALGVILGLATLSKYTGLTLAPVIFAALLAAGVLNGSGFSLILFSLSLFITTFSLTCGWWFLRNYSEYGSDILGTRTMYETWSQILPRENGQIVNPWPPVHKTSWWRFVFFDFWGLFGYMNRYLWRPFYIAFLILSGASIFGWARTLRSPRVERRTFAIWLTLVACALLNFASVLSVTLQNVSGPHGRYLFPSEIAIMALLLAGFSKFSARVCSVCTGALIAISVAANVSGFVTYYWPTAL